MAYILLRFVAASMLFTWEGKDDFNATLPRLPYVFKVSFKISVAEPEPQGAASFGRSRSHNVMRLRLLQTK
jgi:hypothetical protein